MAIDKSERRVRAMFAQIARRYDFLNHLLSAGIDVYWRSRTANAARSIEGPVLDVCTGTGDLAFTLLKRLSAGTKIIGTDFTHEMLILAREKARRRDIESAVTFIESDAQWLPFRDGSFGLVTIAFGLRNVTNTERGLREMLRVCRPGGELFVLEFSQPTLPVLSSIYRSYFRYVLPKIGQFVARNQQSAYEYLPESVSEFPSGEALVQLMQSCGVTDVQSVPLTLGVVTLYRGKKAQTDSVPGSLQ